MQRINHKQLGKLRYKSLSYQFATCLIKTFIDHNMFTLLSGILLLTGQVLGQLPLASIDNTRQTQQASATDGEQQMPLTIDSTTLSPLSKTLFNVPITVTEISTDSPSLHYCEVFVSNNKELKEIGSIWIAPLDPCSLHSCQLDHRGVPIEVVTKDKCGDFYCDIDSEVRPKNGSCCGECVRTKCRYNDEVYNIGHTWHNNAECTLYECDQLPNGLPVINTYQKTCPPLPKDCPVERLYSDKCCQYCREPVQQINTARNILLQSEAEDIWTEEFYRNHPCVRECQMGEAPRTCHYTFVVEWYETLSKACYNCPKNGTDCKRPHCISGDGIARSITVVNRMMPGPTIEVCENDMIVVDVKNHLLGESTTIHWHGMHMKETPYMDGVPHITQCPISPHSTFRYRFKAENSGTHFWHSHTGMQRGDGVFGALIVKRPRTEDPHGHLYDFDLSDHLMIVQDWVHVPGISMFASHHHSKGDNKPLNLLLNGRGRYYKAIWDEIKAAENQKPKGKAVTEIETGTTIKSSVPSVKDFQAKSGFIPYTEKPLGGAENKTNNETFEEEDILILHPLDDTTVNNMRYKQNQITRLARLAPKRSEAEEQQSNERQTAEQPATPLKSHRVKRELDPEIPLDFIPLQQYNVTRGFRYRFRIINAEFLNCPIKISIDNHTLTAFNSDGFDFEAVEVGSIVTYAGERFDFVLHADQPVGNYWIRLKGLMDCDERFTSAFQVAILHYDSANDDEPIDQLGYSHQPAGIELNTMNQGSGHENALTIAELTALPRYDKVPGLDRDALKPVADYKFFVYYDFYRKDNPEFHPREYYGMDANITNANRVFTPQLNHISLQFPSMALLPARDSIDDSMFCNETTLAEKGIDCRKEFCKCHHVLQVPLNSIVELIVIDEGFTYDANHPFHLHGNAFRVVGLERLGQNVTVEMVKQLDRYNLLKRNLVRPPVKDTVTIPDGGYTIIRFEAHNPGFWLFHCHIEFHAEIGMALVIKVGDNNEMVPVPKNFPTCHDYVPEANDDKDDNKPHEENEKPLKPGDSDAATVSKQISYYIPIGLLALLRLLR